MSGEADEAGGLSPGNEENEAGRGFRPEKPYLPLSIEGKEKAKTEKTPEYMEGATSYESYSTYLPGGAGPGRARDVRQAGFSGQGPPRH